VEARDRRAVEAHPSLECVVELRRVDGEALQLPEDVGEPEANEADVAVVDDRFDVVRGPRLVGHVLPVGRVKRKRAAYWRGSQSCAQLLSARTVGSRARPLAVSAYSTRTGPA